VQLSEEVQDEINWKASGQYSAKSAYEVRFLSSITSVLYKIVWKAWATIMGFGPQIASKAAQIVGYALFANKRWTICKLLLHHLFLELHSGLVGHP
jgi:hypothetical protein